MTGKGLDAAAHGVDAIIHCASSPFSKARRVDVEGTVRLLAAAIRAGVSHLVYISIVGIDRTASYPCYRIKLDTERIVESSPVPYTILRATQFSLAVYLLYSVPLFLRHLTHTRAFSVGDNLAMHIHASLYGRNSRG